jgi:outer membrane receptor protein involved in Fe transport
MSDVVYLAPYILFLICTRRYRMGQTLSAIYWAVLVGALTIAASAQSNTSSIRGIVTDGTGAALPETSVVVDEEQTGQRRSLMTDSQGRYNAVDLPIGRYQITFRHAGFIVAKKTGIALTVGSQLTLDQRMLAGAASQEVNVQAATKQVEVNSSTLSSLVDQRQMRELPLNGRNIEQLILLSPGVQSAQNTGILFYGASNNYSISGSRPTGQELLLDGAPIQDFWDHGSGSSIIGTSLGVDSIAEFQTFTNTYGAQFGGNGGGINAVTKSGTNDLHGSAYEFLRESVLDARNYFDPARKPSFHRNQFGGTLGGPIQRNRLFYFLNYEGLRQSLGETQISTVPDAAARAEATNPLVVSILNALPLPNLNDNGNGTGQIAVVGTQIAMEDYIVGRADYGINDKHSLFGRYIEDRADLRDPFAANTLAQYPELASARNYFMTIGESAVLSPTLINKVQFDFTSTNQSAGTNTRVPAFNFIPGNPSDTAFTIPGLTRQAIGVNSSSVIPFGYLQDKYEGQDTLYKTIRSHSLAAGFLGRYVASNVFSDLFGGGFFTFTSYGYNPSGGAPLSTPTGSFLSGQPYVFFGAQAGGANSQRDFRNSEWSWFIQDDWKASPRLTINAGLRYDFISNPTDNRNLLQAILDPGTSTGFTPVSHVFRNNPSLANIDPRFGIAYSLDESKKTVLRAGFGVFHDVIKARSYFAEYTLAPPYNFSTVVLPRFTSPFSFQSVAGLNALAPTISQALPYDLKHTPYTMQYNVNLERSLGSNTVLTLAYVGARGVHLLLQTEVNPQSLSPGSTPKNPVFTSAAGVANRRLNPSFGTVDLLEPFGFSQYHALQASLVRNFSKGFQYQLAYTYSKSIDNGSTTYSLEGDTGLVENPYNIDADRGLSSFDARHNLTVNAIYNLPWRNNNPLFSGWQLSDIFTAIAGRPFTVKAGVDQAGLGESVVNAVRPNIVPGRSLHSIYVHRQSEWIDPTAFQLQPTGTLGNEPRNVFIGPRLWQDDLALLKSLPIHAASEAINLQFRVECFNLLNHSNFNLPTSGLNGGGIFSQAGVVNPAGAAITSTVTTNRQIQFALKALF